MQVLKPNDLKRRTHGKIFTRKFFFSDKEQFPLNGRNEIVAFKVKIIDKSWLQRR